MVAIFVSVTVASAADHQPAGLVCNFSRTPVLRLIYMKPEYLIDSSQSRNTKQS